MSVKNSVLVGDDEWVGRAFHGGGPLSLAVAFRKFQKYSHCSKINHTVSNKIIGGLYKFDDPLFF